MHKQIELPTSYGKPMKHRFLGRLNQLLSQLPVHPLLPRLHRAMASSSNIEELQKLRDEFDSSLQSFAADSSSTFSIIHTVPDSSSTPSSTSPAADLQTLYVLDSSFNPPTYAHLTLIQRAIQNDKGARPCRVCLLLATENADKKPKPASFEDRLVLMSLMAQNLRASLREQGAQKEADDLAVDVAVTKKPFFMDKAQSIDGSGVYGDAQQVHVTGYDTIIRIFNPKYYPQDQKLRVLEPFLSKHRLRVCYRVGGDGSGGGDVSREAQEAYVEAIGDGSREAEGMKKEWRKMVELVDDAESVEGVSSTESRKAAQEGRKGDLAKLVGENVAEYVISERLYAEPDAVKKSYN